MANVYEALGLSVWEALPKRNLGLHYQNLIYNRGL